MTDDAGARGDEYTPWGTDLFGNPVQQEGAGRMHQRFTVPPFTVLDARSGYWRDRKRAWLSMGIQSEEGRDLELSGRPMGRIHEWTAKTVGEHAPGAGLSIFDPVLTETAYRWFCPSGGQVVDPFAGGSVRGVVAHVLGRPYWGSELRRVQVEANYRQAADLLGTEGYGPGALTPYERCGEVWLKRDDLYAVNGVVGGKVRTCWSLAQGAPGLVTAGARHSPQVAIVAAVAESLGVPCRVHTAAGDETAQMRWAAGCGAEVVQHRPGYGSVLTARARDDAELSGWRLVPFGMECREAVEQTRGQVAGLPAGVQRLVVPVGSGMSLAGILWGLRDLGRQLPVLGVVVGADPRGRLGRYAPPRWADMVDLVPASVKYQEGVEARVGPVLLDPIYEAKCAEHLVPGDCLWCVGVRPGVTPPPPEYRGPVWVCGDAAECLPSCPPADFVFTCPPYGDLEVYSDDPRDLSQMEYGDFVDAYRSIVAAAVDRLRDDRFAGLVVAEFRDKTTGLNVGFVPDTHRALVDAGAGSYNEVVVATPIGSLPLRAGRYLRTTRKLGKAHQQLLVHVKGDPTAAAEACKSEEDYYDPGAEKEGW